MRKKKFVYGVHKSKVVDKFGNILKYENSEAVGLATDKSMKLYKSTGKKPEIKLERYTNFFKDELDRNLTQVVIVNPTEKSVLFEYEEYYISDDLGNSEYVDSTVVPYDEFFVLSRYISTQEPGHEPKSVAVATYFDYSGKELNIGKVKFKRDKNFESKINELIAEKSLN